MVKKKGIVSKLILGLFVLTAISFCFLGRTFARYTSSGTGSATADIAKWSVTFAQPESQPVKLGMISPDDTAYNGETHQTTPRSHTGDKVLVATITNESAVEADVTIEIGGITLSGFDGAWGAGYTASETPDGSPSAEQAVKLFSIKLYYDADDLDTNSSEAATDEITSGETTITLGVGSEAPTVLNIFAEVTWTSADATLQSNSDALDTWVGQNITGLASTLTFTAVQGSEQPSA